MGSDIELIKKSGYFNVKWYSEKYLKAEKNIDPIKHYTEKGFKLGYDPSEFFSTNYYKETYNDVAASGINPLIHYLRFGKLEGRLPKKLVIHRHHTRETVDIIIPVYNALADVKKCLESVFANSKGTGFFVIIVNDCSDEETSTFLKTFCEGKENFILIENEQNQGYTKSVNIGLRKSKSDYIVTLNSDTIVSKNWLKGLLRCINSDPKLGIVGPLSNAASWQSVPVLRENNKFHINEIPANWDVEDMSRIIAQSSFRDYPRVPFVNGFCFMLKREVLIAIGYLDELNFPVGYGEENDLCIRAMNRNFQLAIADDVYVFHAKSKSFGQSKKEELSQKGHAALLKKHTPEKFEALLEKIKNTHALDRIRNRIINTIKRQESINEGVYKGKFSVLFVLPVKGGSGGANSVIQEASLMLEFGIEAMVAVKDVDLESVKDLYKDLENTDKLFVGFNEETIPHIASDFDIVVATIFNSVGIVKSITDKNKAILPAYYIQDYEPFFFNENSLLWKQALDSYSVLSTGLLFAKTSWIINKVKEQTQISIHKVRPSIDNSIYYPYFNSVHEKVVITAMIRPKTPRRGADRTISVLRKIATQFFGKIEIKIFGSESNTKEVESLNIDFEHENLGILSRPEVAQLLRESDVFIDLSDYQAFGRSGLEAMASGCVTVSTKFGGVDEYIIEGVNSILVDPFMEEEAVQSLSKLILNRDLLEKIKLEAIETASNFSTLKAAISEIQLFKRELFLHRKKYPRREKKKLYYLTSKEFNQWKSIDKKSHLRVIYPLKQETLLNNFETIEVDHISFIPKDEKEQRIVFIELTNNFFNKEFEDWLNSVDLNYTKIVVDIARLNDFKELNSNIDLSKMLTKFSGVISDEPISKDFKKIKKQFIFQPEFDTELWRVGKPKLTGKGVFEKKKGDPFRFGFIGDEDDYSALEKFAPSFKAAKAISDTDIEFEVIGAYQTKKTIVGTKIGLPRKRDYSFYVHWLHQRVNWDVGIIYIENPNPSEIELKVFYEKYLEYSALGLITLASVQLKSIENLKDNENILFVENDWSKWAERIINLQKYENIKIELMKNSKSILTNYLKDNTLNFELNDFYFKLLG